MFLNRRAFVLTLGSTALLTATHNGWSASPGSATVPTSTSAPSGGNTIIDAGQLNEFSKDGVYAGHRDDGFFVIRRDGHLFALSSICTHRGCKVMPQDDQTYACKCHGSTFDKDGKVTKGPASKDLPRLAVATDSSLHLKVELNQKFEAGHFHPPDTPKSN